jgi:hypothetical protein
MVMFRHVCLAGICVALIGCQRTAAPSRTVYPATGVVTYKNGGPVTGRIKFRPVGNSSYLADGMVGTDGKFSLSTRYVGSEEAVPGIPAGRHLVTVVPMVGANRRPPVELPDPVEVQASENTFAFEIARPGS